MPRRAILLLVCLAASLALVPAANAAAPTLDATGCDAGQQAALQQAVLDARVYAADAQGYFRRRTPGSGFARYGEWFGAYDAGRWTHVQTTFAAVGALLAADVVRVTCGDPACGGGTYSFVYPTDPTHRFYACDLFWTAPATGADSKAGTLVHEYTHFDDVAATEDHAFGRTDAEDLAINHPEQAVDNADSYEAFAENEPASADVAPEVVASVERLAFPATAVGGHAALAVTVRNVGDGPATMGAVAASAGFAIDGDACSSRILAAGAACAFKVVFAPTVHGARSGSATVATDAVATPAAIALSGRALRVGTASVRGLPHRRLRVRFASAPAARRSYRLERRQHGAWRAVGGTRSAKGGRAVILVQPGTYRVVVPADADYAAKNYGTRG